ncbi:C40 family peptidase [Alteribacter keqinensis]|uniref:NlpC/P60 family protein n=1 Tax=Alteribacter keqinensis TaxID=2483800 RepID=A0A3M7TYG7_9BACI|nr:C40 family peptidase [Alteribacter keqinensis]RNA69844.1 NlpC/P60 family protein [Alteribacter keqinensis]
MSTEYIVKAAVATLWTSPDKPREMDQAALKEPADIRGWLGGLTTEDRRQVTDDNIVQSQVLYGQMVTLIEEREDWLHVCVNDQPSRKSEKGYPGWIPKCQVIERSETNIEPDTPFAAVKTQTAWLYQNQEPILEISYETRLPLASDIVEGAFVSVNTPHGAAQIKSGDVNVYEKERDIPAPLGEALVKNGEMFLELPYLWGGMSGFGFDCSGFTYTVHRHFGITIPRDASDQEKAGEPVAREDLKPGDCIYFAKDEGKGFVYHVGFYYGDGQMLHAPSAGKGIEIVPIKNTKYDKNYRSARRFW